MRLNGNFSDEIAAGIDGVGVDLVDDDDANSDVISVGFESSISQYTIILHIAPIEKCYLPRFHSRAVFEH